MMTPRNTFLIFTAALMASGCDFTKFDDLEDKAPATRLEAGNGKPLLGFAKRDDAVGGILLMASTEGKGAIAQVRFDEKGGTRVGKTATDDYTDLNKLNLDGYYARSFAPVWAGAESGFLTQGPVGPLAFIGSTAGASGKVQLVDTDSWREKIEVANEATPDFGSALALARFSDPSGAQAAKDLVVGAQGQVFFVDGSQYPLYPTSSLIGCTPDGGLASYVYTAVAAAHSTPALIVAAAPAANFVTVMSTFDSLRTIGDCSGVNFDTVAVPTDAQQFGAALLLTDLDGDLDQDLVVGAPEQGGGGAVYIYDTVTGYAPNQAIVLQPPADADAALFGASLAIGSFDGKNRMLAVGAPGSNGDAGKIFLYKVSDLSAGGSSFVPFGVVELDGGGSDKLGMGLAVVPLKQGAVTRDLLIGGAKSSALVFWANTTPDHKDYRTTTP